jgi:hypothetical protein
MNKYNKVIKELVAQSASKSELCNPSYGLDRYNNKLKVGRKIIWKGSYNTVEIWREVIKKINKLDPGWEPYDPNSNGKYYGMYKKFAN